MSYLFIFLFPLHTSVLSDSCKKVCPISQAGLKKGEDVAAAISYVNPFDSFWWRSNMSYRAFPDLAFPLSLESLCLSLLFWCKLSQKGFLMHDPQDFLVLGGHCQNRLQQHPMLFLVFERSESL